MDDRILHPHYQEVNVNIKLIKSPSTLEVHLPEA